MTTQTTKIELVTEALETLIRTIVVHQSEQTNPRKCFEQVVEARSALSDSLKILLAPNLRVLPTVDRPEPPALKVSGSARALFPGGIDDMNLA